MTIKPFYKINVRQRVLYKKTSFSCVIFNEYAELDYKNKTQAEMTFRRMKEAGTKCEYKRGILTEHFKGKSADEIYDMYLRDIKVAQSQNGIKMNVDYDVEILTGEKNADNN